MGNWAARAGWRLRDLVISNPCLQSISIVPDLELAVCKSGLLWAL